MRRQPTLALALASGLIATALVLPGTFAATAAAGDPVSTINVVPGEDPTSQIRIAWQAPRASSNQNPPATRLLLGLADSFSCSHSLWSSPDVIVPTATVISGVSYAKAFVDGLEPNSQYSYCVLTEPGYATKIGSFATAATDSTSTTFLAFADAAWSSTSSSNQFANTVQYAQASYPDASFMTHNGDLTSSSTDLGRWNGFLDHSALALGKLPWAPTQSNGSSVFFANGAAVPAEAGASQSGFYAVRDKNLLLLVINTNVTNNLTALTGFMEDQISKAGPDAWVVVSVPGQMYGTSQITASSGYLPDLRRIFSEHKVALVLQGGAKAYTRSWPVKVNPSGVAVFRDYPGTETIATGDGVVYVTPGASGIGLGSVSSAALTGSSNWLAVASPYSSATASTALKKSFSAITASAAGLSVTAQMVDGTELDSFTIKRIETPDYEPRSLTYTGLNNSFGQDAVSERTITWLAGSSTGYTRPFYKIAVGDDDISVATRQPCAAPQKMASALSSYNSHTCQLTGLADGVTYRYKVGAFIGQRPYESREYTFTTAPSLSAEPWQFIDIADSQASNAAGFRDYWGKTLSTALNTYGDAVLVTQSGDIVNTATSTTELTGWLQATEDNLAGVAFNPVLGNHDSAGAAQAMWNALFPRPSVVPLITPSQYSSAATLQYAQVYRNVLFLHINTNLESLSDLNLTERWIQQTVSQTGFDDGDLGKFIVVVQHKSPFGGEHAGKGSFPQGTSLTSKNLVARLPKIYSDAGVDLVLAGHDHNLLRSWPVQWPDLGSRAVWTTDLTDPDQINSDSDGLVYYVPHQAADRSPYANPTQSDLDRGNYPWIAKKLAPAKSVNNSAFAVVTVNPTSLEVKTYLTGAPKVAIDSFTITQGYPDPEVSASSATITIGGNDTGLAVTISTNQKAWKAESLDSWLVVASDKPTDGGMLNLKVQPNSTGVSRTAQIRLTAGSAESWIWLTQDPAS
ncbi:MAG: metallophosphoesterase [Micrococcales bacterium]|nr:metallophosphoesterase [Micrococcales bacterium]